MKNYKLKNPLYKTVETFGSVQEPLATYGIVAKCLYCYEKLRPNDHEHYHLACSKKFFGQAYAPSFDFNLENLKTLAKNFLSTSMAVTGVQAKVSLSWHKKEEKNTVKKLTIVGLYGDYILKPPSDHYESLPEVEDCTMHMAEVCGLKTVPHSLFYLNDGSLCYLTKRIDRNRNSQKHMEDMCQLSERLTEDKYKGSHEQVAKLLLKHSAAPLLDVGYFYELVLFSFFTGNADMHLKNFSLLESDVRGKYMLSPAYDLLNTALVNPLDKEELALTLNGKKSKLKYEDFLVAFLQAGLSKKYLDTTLENFYYCKLEMQDCIDKSFLSEKLKTAYKLLLESRLKRLTSGLNF